MTLTDKEELLVESLRKLPPETAEQVVHWTQQLAELANGGSVEWSDCWSEEDMRDATASSLRVFGQREQD